MKTLFLIFSLVLVAGFFFLTSCGNDENENEIELTVQQEQAKILSGTWTIQIAATPQGVDPAILKDGTMNLIQIKVIIQPLLVLQEYLISSLVVILLHGLLMVVLLIR